MKRALRKIYLKSRQVLGNPPLPEEQLGCKPDEMDLRDLEKTVSMNRPITREHYLERINKREIINQLMKVKYTWGDTFFATVFGGRDGSIPVELHPVPAD